MWSSSIGDLNIDIEIYPKKIKLLDSLTKDLLKEKTLIEEYYSAKPSSKKPYAYDLGKIKLPDAYATYKIDLFEIKQALRTNGGYITKIGFSGNKGFFICHNEFGYLNLENDSLKIGTVYLIDGISYGLYDFEKDLFFIHQTDVGLECWDLTTPIPLNRWTHKEVNINKGLGLTEEGLLVTGNIKGEINFYDKNTGKLQNKCKPFNQPIRQITITDHIVVLNIEEKIYKITRKGKMIWEQNLPKQKRTISLTSLNGFLWVVFYDGMIYQIDDSNGEIIEKYTDLEKEIFSSVAIFKNWIIYASNEALNWFKIENKEKKSKLVIKETVCRALTCTKKGIVIGDDNGQIFYLEYPAIK